VTNANPARSYNPATLVAELPKAYGLSQPAPLVPAVAYNAAFGTNDTDVYGHVATGSGAQPTLDFATSVGGGIITLTGLTLVTSGGTATPGGTIAGNATPGSGTGYDPLKPPKVVFNNTVNTVSCLVASGTPASATAVVDSGTHQVTQITNFNGGSGYTCAPIVTFENLPGTSGVGAQVTVQSSNAFSIPVQTKAEQELFDNYGRYNSTGGAELPLTNGVVQTTVPLNYIDSATEILQDGEVQIWKLVDNGLWTNSMHFNMVDVQLINRVGWDGTVKVPASNELGWKDTLRLNPLEDVIVAMRAKRPSVPFGMPKSSRLMDPSKNAGVGTAPAGTPTSAAYASGLGFTVATGVTPLPLQVNTVSDYDNEFAWGSAILGHAENDLTRPVVFHPTVTVPAAPTNLTDAAGNGMLTWTDPTPAATSLGNPQNELEFRILKSPLNNFGNPTSYSQVATVKANVTRWTDPNAATVPGAYQVVAYNVAGPSPASNSFIEAIPVAPTALTQGALAYNSVTFSWTNNSFTNSLQVLRDGVAIGLVLPGTTTSFTDATVAPLQQYSYTVVASNALKTVTSAPLVVNTPQIPMTAPTGVTATTNTAGTAATVRWFDAANNETAYWLEVSADGGNTYAPAVVLNSTGTQPAAVNRAMTSIVTTVPGSAYVFKVTAINVTGTATSKSASVTATLDLSAPAAPLAPALALSSQTATRAAFSWPAVTVPATVPATTVSYVVQTGTNGVLGTALPQQTALTYNLAITAGNNYSMQVLAQASRFGLTTQSLASTVMPVNTPPAASSRVTATAGARNSKAITVTWTNGSRNLTGGWTVIRTGGGTTATITPTIATAGTGYSFTDTGLTAGVSYTYQLQASSLGGTTTATTNAATAR
jgi:hypothetical protein